MVITVYVNVQVQQNDHKLICFCFHLFAVTLDIMNHINIETFCSWSNQTNCPDRKKIVNSLIALKFKLFSRRNESIAMSDAH